MVDVGLWMGVAVTVSDVRLPSCFFSTSSIFTLKMILADSYAINRLFSHLEE